MNHTLAIVLYVLAAVFLALSYLFSKPSPPSPYAGWSIPAGLTSLALLLFVIADHFEPV